MANGKVGENLNCMSGGRLVVLDRSGRAGKAFPLPRGAATLGRAPACDIRVLQPAVAPHHATVAVHANQTVVRNAADGETLVNGHIVSVAALEHNDVITIGDRSLRWEYDDPTVERPLAAEPALYSGGRSPRAPRRATADPPPPALHHHRASMPGNAGGKQVAIVQPQRRDTSELVDASPPAPPRGSSRRGARTEAPPSPAPAPAARETRISPKTLALHNTTKATLWIESRKSSPRSRVKLSTPPAPVPARRARTSRKHTPLRLAVLKRAQITKIEAPLHVDHMKQAALMLMTGHTPKSKLSSLTPARRPSGQPSPATPNKRTSNTTPNKRIGQLDITTSNKRKSDQSPVSPSKRKSDQSTPNKRASSQSSPASNKRKSNTSQRSSVRLSPHPPASARQHRPASNTPSLLVKKGSPRSTPRRGRHSARNSSRYSEAASVSVLELSDSTAPLGSPLLSSPKKSALKDPTAKKSSRKTESIKFDFSNLEGYSRDDDVLLLSSSRLTRNDSSSKLDTSDDTLYASYDTHSRSSRMLEQLGSPMKDSRVSTRATLTPESPSARKSLRGSVMVQKVLGTPELENTTRTSRRSQTLPDHSWDATAESAFKTRTLSPRSPRNLESYSIVDLVSGDSDLSKSMYDSVGSTRSSSIVFGTPTGGRKTRSTIEPNLLGSSTPYVKQTRASNRSNSSPNISKTSPNKSKNASKRRSRSLTTPENSEETQKHISINSTRISRASRSRSHITRSSMLSPSDKLAVAVEAYRSAGGGDSPRSSRRSTAESRLQLAVDEYREATGNSPRNSTRNSAGNNSTRTSVGHNSTRASLANNTTRVSSGNNSTRASLGNNTTRVSSGNNSTRTSVGNNSTRASVGNNSTKKNLSPKQTSVQKSPRSNQTSPEKTPSPRNSSRKSSPRKSVSQKSSPGNRSRRSDLTLNTNLTIQSEEGAVTPENAHSPEEASTPVLSIRSLLNSSQSSVVSQSPKKTRTNLKRKTIGVISARKPRASLKSKSFTASVRKSLRSLRLSRESDRTLDNTIDSEENATPKSSVKLVQEEVKNKHSTAKKPQSKRSIIDNLNDSDIVKQLFNSPVKRKLSQSMTEFSRKNLFDDEDYTVNRRPTRNTIALTGRSPTSDSVLEQTRHFTLEQFVSPLSTPGNSPNLTGVKRLYAKNTPNNDLRSIKGVKKLLQTPRTRKSVKNDLTNVAGVKAVFAKSPRNRLSDVRVKEVFAASPNNDLRRVSGVKSLFGSQKERKSPRNDLSDVRGVRDLFTRKSVANDLRNVSGVKKVMRANTPRNDLRDVRGVKKLLKEHKQKQANYHDVSGVEELFNESNLSNTSLRNSEALFDQLIGKPPIKAVYSKSFIAKDKKKRNRATKSMHDSIDFVTNNVEEWLQREFQKCLHKDKESSKNSRELQKLATDTVEGNGPLYTSRNRNSTLTQTQVDNTSKRSASQVYSARKLPIKKRSFVEASLETTADRSRSNTLPIKKRIVSHSTPVKGRYNMTMNASELGRVSPIAAVDATLQDATTRSPKGKQRKTIAEQETVIVSDQKSSPHARSRRAIQYKDTDANASPKSPKATKETSRRDVSKPTRKTGSKENDTESPKQKTRQTKTKEVSKIESPKARNMRGRKGKSVANDITAEPSGRRSRRNKTETENTKKGRKSLVITKKAPILSPKPQRPKVANRKADDTAEKPKSPKATRARLIVSKPSPKLNPQVVKRGTRNTNTQNPESPKPSAKPKRGRKVTESKPEETSPVKIQTTKRGRQTEKEDVEPPSKRSRNARGKDSAPPSPRKTRQAPKENKTVAKKPVSPKKTVATKKPASPKKTVSFKTTPPKKVATKRAAPKASPSPKPVSPKKTRNATKPASPKKTRNTKPVSPAKSAATKKSTTSKTASPAKSVSPKKTRRTAKASPKKAEITKATPPKKAVATKKSAPSPKPSPKKTRNTAKLSPKKTVATKKTPTPKKTTAKKATKTAPKPESPQETKRGRRNAAQAIAETKRSRGKNTSQEIQVTRTNRRTKNDSTVPVNEAPKGRKRKMTEEPIAIPAKVAKTAKGKKSAMNEKVEKVVKENKKSPKKTPAKEKRAQPKSKKQEPEKKSVRGKKQSAAAASRRTKPSASPDKAIKTTRSRRR